MRPFALALPPPPAVEAASRSLALLDSILMPEWQYRYFSFDPRWGEGRRMGSMRDGEGSWYHILFAGDDAVIKGFAKDSTLGRRTAASLTDSRELTLGVDHPLVREAAAEPAFEPEVASFFAWHIGGSTWSCADAQMLAETGAPQLLRWLVGGPEAYQAWAEAYYERPVPLEAVRSVFASGGRPSQEMFARLAPGRNHEEWKVENLGEDA